MQHPGRFESRRLLGHGAPSPPSHSRGSRTGRIVADVLALAEPPAELLGGLGPVSRATRIRTSPRGRTR